ncbi:MAG: hypothetical protein ACYC4Q_07515, partial [Victivallaceae bacterium]
MPKLLTIQPDGPKLGRMPYPWHVNEDGSILHQKFWKGKPVRCAGFAPKTVQEIRITVQDFFKECNLKSIKKLQPVFGDAGGGMWTMLGKYTA